MEDLDEKIKEFDPKIKAKNPGAIIKAERKGYHRRCLEEGLRNPCYPEKLKTRRRRRSKMKKEVWNNWKWNINLLKRKSSKGPRVKNVGLKFLLGQYHHQQQQQQQVKLTIMALFENIYKKDYV